MRIEFGNYPLRLKSDGNRQLIYDPIRKKWVVLTPEEQVRQIWIQYLLNDKGFSPSKIAVERGIEVNGKSKRFDICIYDNDLSPTVLIECKGPRVKLRKPGVEQLSIYNIQLGAKKFILSNGVQHLGFEISDEGVKILDRF